MRVASFVDGDVVNFESLEHGGARTAPTLESVAVRPTSSGIDDPIDTPVYDQDLLGADRVITGPAIVTTENTTFLVEPGWRLEPTAQGAVWFLQD